MDKEVLKRMYCFDFIGNFDSNGITRVQRGGDWGFFNIDENLVTGLIYKYVYSFSKGHAIVESETGHGLIDLKGNEVVPCNLTLEQARAKQAELSI